MRPDLAPERFADVAIDPMLMGAALEAAVDGPRPGRDPSALLAACLAAYAGHAGIDPADGLDGLTDADLDVVMALVMRVTALSGLLAGRGFDRGAVDPDAAVFAASRARLIARDGRPAFQLLDFLAEAARAAGDGRLP